MSKVPTKMALALAPLLWCGVARAAVCAATPAIQERLRAHPDAGAYSQAGAWFGDHRMFDCAADAFRSALKLEPRSAHLNYLYGLSLLTGGRLADAIEPLEQSAKIEPGLVQTHLLLGSALAGLGHPKDAEAEWEAALKIDPNSTIALDGLCKALIAQGDSASVIPLLRTAHLDENLTLDLIQAYGQQHMLDDALAVVRQGLKKYPTSSALTSAAVTVYVQDNQPDEAVREAAAAAAARPHDLDTQIAYLRVLTLIVDRTQGPAQAKKLMVMAPHNADVLYLTGILERAAGDFTASRAHIEEALSIQPNIPNARYNLGMTLLQLDDYQGAKEQFLKALDLGVTAAQLRFELGTALRKLGATDEAKKQFQLYQEESQAEEKTGLALHDATLASRALAAGDASKAAELYRLALKATPDDVKLSYKLAMLLDGTGDFAEERTVLEHAVGVNPNFALGQYQLGYVESRQGDTGAAEEQFRQAVRAAPGYSQAWISLAATLGMESRFPEAREAVANALRLDPQDVAATQLSKDLARANGQN